jgi:hypothetical protein
VGNEFSEVGNMQTGRSPKAGKNKSYLMRVWRQLDEEWFKPWFGGLPRTPTALEQRHKVLLMELGRAEAKLREDQMTAVSTEELVTGLNLEVLDLAKQIRLVQGRQRIARQQEAQVAAANAALAAAANANAAEAPLEPEPGSE